jgi:hypothetical protein
MRKHSCITASVCRVDGILEAKTLTRQGVLCTCSREDGVLKAKTSPRLGILCTCSRTSGITAHVTLVCPITQHPYLIVIPKEVQWITVGNSVDYNIESNTDWNIIY